MAGREADKDVGGVSVSLRAVLLLIRTLRSDSSRSIAHALVKQLHFLTSGLEVPLFDFSCTLSDY